MVPEPEPASLRDTGSGEPGLRLEFLAADGTVIESEHRSSTSLAWWDGVPPGFGWGESGRIALQGSFLPDVTGPHLIGAAGVGRLIITVDGATVADEATSIPADPVEAMTRPGEVRATVMLEAGRAAQVRPGFR